VLVRVSFSASDEAATVQSDETSLNSQVQVVRKGQRSSLNSNSFENGGVLIDEESGSLGDVDEVVVNWRNIDTPG
jgi:predicted sugar kinase